MIRHNLRAKITQEKFDYTSDLITTREKNPNENLFKSGIDLSSVLRENISLSESLGLCFLVTAPIGIVCVFTLRSSGRRASRGESEMSRHASYVTSLH